MTVQVLPSKNLLYIPPKLYNIWLQASSNYFFHCYHITQNIIIEECIVQYRAEVDRGMQNVACFVTDENMRDSYILSFFITVSFGDRVTKKFPC